MGRASGSACGRPSIVSGSMVWMAARARPHWAVRARRAPAHSGSRRILRGIVSPSRRSTTSQAAPRVPRSPMATTAGTGTPAVRAASSSTRSRRTFASPAASPARSTWRMSGRVAPPAAGSRSNALGDPRGAAGQPPQAAHAAAESRLEGGGQLVAAQAGGHRRPLTRRGRLASRRRRAGAGTRRCRSRCGPCRRPRRSSRPAPR